MKLDPKIIAALLAGLASVSCGEKTANGSETKSTNASNEENSINLSRVKDLVTALDRVGVKKIEENGKFDLKPTNLPNLAQSASRAGFALEVLPETSMLDGHIRLRVTENLDHLPVDRKTLKESKIEELINSEAMLSPRQDVGH